ncbi:MAG: hypothetical protein VX733_10125 [Candidatus Latescibacterota bacterium]|nr:hypothetical protein [Candidatus Latescibacterota bacterium]
MGALDWSIVVALNGGTILYGLYLSRNVSTSTDWFLAGRQLPWWLVGLSMYATAIDSSDLVADSGGTYTMGMSVLAANWVGVIGGWLLAGFFVFLPMYRIGMYTNAEYLEARFGTAARVLCALVQVQYRTLVLAIIGTSVFLTLSVVCGWDAVTSWSVVVGIAVLATIYTAFGGLRSVAVTDALQFGIMTAAGLIIWVSLWQQVDGWQGAEQRLRSADPELVELMTLGHDQVEVEPVGGVADDLIKRKLLLGGSYDNTQGTITRTTPGWLVALAFVIIGVAYSVVNHTQAMRMFASRNEWHLKMSIFAAAVPMLAMSFFNLTIGVMGRALMPEQADLPYGRQDSIYPYVASQVATVGLRGMVVAGMLAAALSTYDSIGSSLSALLTRDVYARILVRDRDDRHYLRVGQWLTPIIIMGSFAYVPFMEAGMLKFYVDVTSTFVIPLLTLFLMGVLTSVSRISGLIGLLAGVLYGVVRMLSSMIAENHGIALLPPIMANSWAAYPISMVVTAVTMILVSVFAGWEGAAVRLGEEHREDSPWLRDSLHAVQELDRSHEEDSSHRSDSLPLLLAVTVFGLGCVFAFAVFW